MTHQGSAGVKPADFEQLEDKEESVVRGQRHNKLNVTTANITTAQIPKYRVTWLHKRPRMSGDGWMWRQSFILSVESITIVCGNDLNI